MPLRVGVVCEGPTDYHAISSFMGAALQSVGIVASFIDIQPDMGRTLPEAGWGNIELWLKNNPPKQRVRQYFDGGPFQRNMFAKACDVLLIQMDSDILDDEKFRSHLRNTESIELADITAPSERGKKISYILERWSLIADLTEADRKRHIFAPAVESTETWCVAAFDNKHETPEALTGADLVHAFMVALESSESRSVGAVGTYVSINKDVDRRKQFCLKHAETGHARIMRCPHFAHAVTQLKSVTQS